MTSETFALAFLLHRHGMRYPFIYFEGIGDPVQPEQFALLTESGRQQMTALGEYLASKYNLSSRNDYNEVSSDDSAPVIVSESISSAVPRCVESSKLIFNGFLKKNVNVSLLETDSNTLYHEMVEQNMASIMAKEFKTNHGTSVGDYISYLNTQAKSKKESMKEKYMIVENILIGKKTGHPIPPYADERTLEECQNLMNRQLIFGFEDKLSAELFEDMRQRLSVFPKVRANYVEYSVSDIHIVSLLKRLGFPISHWPDFGSGFEIVIFADRSVIVNELRISSDAEITEVHLIQKSTVEKLLEKRRDS